MFERTIMTSSERSSWRHCIFDTYNSRVSSLLALVAIWLLLFNATWINTHALWHPNWLVGLLHARVPVTQHSSSFLCIGLLNDKAPVLHDFQHPIIG